jgi:hypothetical protein
MHLGRIAQIFEPSIATTIFMLSKMPRAHALPKMANALVAHV